MKKIPEKNLDKSLVFENDNCDSSVINQKTFSESLGKEFREFRLIEIISENEIVEHIKFVHSYYPGKK